MIGLVSCSAQKLGHAAEARHLYTSPLFQLSRAYAEQRCAAVYVLSAFHGLVELDRVLAPYDQTLGKLAERRLWALQVVYALELRGHQRGEPLMILAGDTYALPLIEALEMERWIGPLQLPLAGLGIGVRLRWLSEQNRLGPRAPALPVPIATFTFDTSRPAPSRIDQFTDEDA